MEYSELILWGFRWTARDLPIYTYVHVSIPAQTSFPSSLAHNLQSFKFYFLMIWFLLYPIFYYKLLCVYLYSSFIISLYIAYPFLNLCVFFSVSYTREIISFHLFACMNWILSVPNLTRVYSSNLSLTPQIKTYLPSLKYQFIYALQPIAQYLNFSSFFVLHNKLMSDLI